MIENQKPVVPADGARALAETLKQQVERRPVEQAFKPQPPKEKK